MPDYSKGTKIKDGDKEETITGLKFNQEGKFLGYTVTGFSGLLSDENIIGGVIVGKTPVTAPAPPKKPQEAPPAPQDEPEEEEPKKKKRKRVA